MTGPRYLLSLLRSRYPRPARPAVVQVVRPRTWRHYAADTVTVLALMVAIGWAAWVLCGKLRELDALKVAHAQHDAEFAECKAIVVQMAEDDYQAVVDYYRNPGAERHP